MPRWMTAVLLMTICGLPIQGRAAAPEFLASNLLPEQVEQRSYLEYAQECVDLLIHHGTDRYGKVTSPLLVNILDVRTRSCPEDPLVFDEPFRVDRRGRRGPAGANLYPDQSTVRAMYAISAATGQRQYADFADRCLAYSLRNLVDEQGFFWWGWHRHYDVYLDQMTGHAGNPHEIHVQQAIWPQLWRVDRDAVTREIQAIWQWHVIDKQTGECNRHGDGNAGCDFAMSGGEILAAFAFLYNQTGQQEWLDRTRLVADYYWRSRNRQTELIPNRPNAGSDRFDGAHFDTSITACLCPRLLMATRWTGDPRFRDQAITYLKAYAKYGFDSETGRFWGSLRLDGSPVPGPRLTDSYAQYEPRGPIDIWQPYAAGYEHPITTALAYAYAAQLSGDPLLRQAAQHWDDNIRRAFPPRQCESISWYADYAKDWAPLGTYAGLYGQTITFALQMQRLTGDDRHRDFARQAAREAISKLYYQGLLRGHPGKPYYESIDGVGYLLCALVQLDQTLKGIPAQNALENW